MLTLEEQSLLNKRALRKIRLALCGFGLLTTTGALADGQISAATAKAEGAVPKSVALCVATCTSKGNGQAYCEKTWCQPGRCYKSAQTYCVR